MKSRTVCQARLTAAHLVAWVATVAAALLGATTLGADPPVKGLIRTIPTSSEPSVSPGVDVALRVYGHGGTAPFEYSWRRNGAIIEDAEVSGDQLKLGPVELTDAGEYTVLVKHAEGEVLSNPFTLDVDPRFRRMPLPELGEACFGAWGDLDGDGWPDLVTTHADHVKVHINARDGTLPLKQSLACGSNPANFVTIGDFDNDGWPDLVVTEINNWHLRIFRNAGAGNLVSQLSEPLDGRYSATTWVDLDGDGYLDLFVPGHEEVLGRLYMNEAGSHFRRWTSQDPGRGLFNRSWVFYVAWGDYDADGRMDAAISCATGAWWLLHRNASGNYDEVPGMSGSHSWPYGRGEVAWADYDNDGDLDLLMGAYSSGNTWLFRNNGGVFQKMTEEEVGSVVTDPASADGVTWGDYDNDGDLDLYVARSYFQSANGETNFFHENLGDGTFRRLRIGSLTSSINTTWTAHWVDYDRDGFLDLYVPADEHPPTHLFRNELGQQGNRNGWLQVRCEGRVTNRDGIGAVVRVKARIGSAERWQMRQIASSGSGQPLLTHFGLGDASKVDLVRVEWPSSAVQEYADVAINQSLVIKEPPRLVPVGPCAIEVKCWPGMHFTVQSSDDLETWTAVGSVTNVDGTATFSDVAGVEGTCRFYRVVDE